MRAESERRTLLLVIVGLVLASGPAHADAGVPMILLVYPGAWIVLPGVILVEALVGAAVTKCKWRNFLKTSAIANLASTGLGIPVTWLVLVGCELITTGGSAWGLATPLRKLMAVTLQSPWLIPYEPELRWMVPAAAAFLCIPFFFMSVWCEDVVARRSYDRKTWPIIRRWAWIANSVSYGLIVLGLIWQVLRELHV